MACHYCGYKTRPVSICPECRSLDVVSSGFGTEHIEEEVLSLFPEMVIRRLDTDSVKKKGVLQKTLSEFRSGKIDLLLGTQMVAKGLNFPGVRLVGIVMADTGLSLPDFRAEERTFSLIVQVSGRAGRYSRDGEVLIQTFKPGNAAVKLAAEGNMEAFYRRELEIREILSFPPFCRIFRIVFRGKVSEKTRKALVSFSSKLHIPEPSELLGPAECPLGIIAGNFRFHILIKAQEFDRIHSILTGVLHGYRPPSGIHLELDIDPLSLL